MKSKKLTTRQVAAMAMLTAVSFLLAFLETAIPLVPGFLKIDISALPVLIGSFAIGPFAGVLISLVKNLLHVPFSTSGGVGQLADFLVTGSFAFVAGLVYQKKRTRTGAVIGSALGILTMAVVGGLSNKFIMIPFYSKIMPIDQIMSICKQVNSLIVDINSYIFYAVVPFNIIKGLIITFVTLAVYKNLSRVINGTSKR